MCSVAYVNHFIKYSNVRRDHGKNQNDTTTNSIPVEWVKQCPKALKVVSLFILHDR